MSIFLNELYLKLSNDATLCALLDTYGTPAQPGIFNARLIPESATGQKYINFYISASINHATEYTDAVVTVNCRALELQDAQAIKTRVIILTNRSLISSQTYGVVMELPTLLPQDSADNFNCPIEIRIKSKA